MGHLKSGWDTRLYRESSDWEEIIIEDADAVTRIRLNDKVLKQVFNAIRVKQVLKISYQSIRKLSESIISPNQIVHADFRYHVRAFCHDDSKFKDYVIGRINEAYPLKYHPLAGNWIEWRSSEKDLDWNSFFELKFKINPKLDEDTRKALSLDYRIEEGGYQKISCRIVLQL